MKGCSSIWVAVNLLDGYQRRHYVIKSIPSAGQFPIRLSSAIGAYSGKLIPFLAACLSPSCQVFGVPNTEVILLIWSIYEFPKNKGFIKYISATIQPTAKISTGAEYAENLNNSSGALYQRVEQYYVKGGFVLIYFAIPKSMSLIFSSWSIRTFYGLRSRWKNPCLWMYERASAICLVMYLIYLSYSVFPFYLLSVISL